MCGCNLNIGKRRNKMAKKRKSTRRRRASVRGLNSKDAGSFLMKGVLPGAAGAVILKMVVDKVLPAEYAQHSNYALLAAGLGAALLVKNPMVQAAGLGAAIVSASNIGQDLVDGQAVSGLGLLRPGVPSVRIAEPRYSPFNQSGVKTM